MRVMVGSNRSAMHTDTEAKHKLRLRWLRRFVVCFVFLIINVPSIKNNRSSSNRNMNMPSYDPVTTVADIPSGDEEPFFCYDPSDGKSDEPRPTTIYKGTEPEHSFDGCFITAVFGISKESSDKFIDVRESRTKYPNYEFLLFTNLVELDAESKGWRKVLHFDTGKGRMITQSRYPKFLAWKESFIEKYCPVIFYMDGSKVTPVGSAAEFSQAKIEILQSEGGLAQFPHSNNFEGELRDIVKYYKDTQEHIDLTRTWVHSQPDFQSWENSLVYLNTYFGYNPNSAMFQKATQFFWDVYSKEQLSWRDQPLWGYVLHHSGLKPVPFSHLFSVKKRNVLRGGHSYGTGAESEVEMFLSLFCSNTNFEGGKDKLFHGTVCSEYCRNRSLLTE